MTFIRVILKVLSDVTTTGRSMSSGCRKQLVGKTCGRRPSNRTSANVEDGDEAFAEKMERLTGVLDEQMAKGAELDGLIRQKLGGLGYEF